MTGYRAHRELLRDVSRSFHLSLRLLPPGMREPVSLAYLLARFTDTLADSTSRPAAERLELLDTFSRWLPDPAPDPPARWREAVAALAAEHPHRGEQVLLASFGRWAPWWRATTDPFRGEILAVLADIIAGQRLDLERFGLPTAGQGEGTLRFLPDAAATGRYTYLVAGTVGRFWSRVGFLDDRRFSSLPPDELAALGERFGRALQLVNILRDVGRDGREGRCYFPVTAFPDGIAAALRDGRWSDDLRPALAPWTRECESMMADGIAYAMTLRRYRARLATAVPALLGIRTLRAWQAAPWPEVLDGVKIPRPEVAGILRRAIPGALRPQPLDRLYRQLAGTGADRGSAGCRPGVRP